MLSVLSGVVTVPQSTATLVIMVFFKTRKNPRTASEVTKEWLEVVLSQHESKTRPDSTVEVTSFEINPGCAKGDNFNSDVLRIVVEARVTSAQGTPLPTHYSLITKFLPGNEAQQAITKAFGAPKREQITLSHILPAFNAFQKERGGDKYRINGPEHVYGVCEVNECVLMMQDLREVGFQVADKRRGLDLSQLKVAVQHMARLHAVSYAFSRTHDFLAMYPDFQDVPIASEMTSAVAKVIIEGLQDALQGRKEEFPGLLEALTSKKDDLASKMRDAVILSGKEAVVCLCHGDFWTNNIMFKYDEAGEVKDFAMIDWGNVYWRSPILDLQYLIATSTQQDLRRDHLREVHMLYYNTFSAAAADMGAPLPHWGFEDFLAEWRRTAVAGLVFGVLVNLITLSEFARKFHHGNLSTGFFSWLKTKLGEAMVLLPNSFIVKMTCKVLKKEFKSLFDDLASMNNSEMTTRVMNIVVEAQQAGVL